MMKEADELTQAAEEVNIEAKGLIPCIIPSESGQA